MITRALSAVSIASRPVVKFLRQRTSILFSKKFIVYTNTGISITMSVSGDSIQQHYQRLKSDGARTWDLRRTMKMALTGLALGPIVHYWYLFLEKRFPGRCLKVLVKKIFVDQLVFSPTCVTVFLLTVGACEGQGTAKLKKEFQETGVRLLLADLILWTPAQAVNFYFIPAKYRVLYDNMVSLTADTVYSYLRFEHRNQTDV
ncbi:mpv17-like protein 2 [Physella acuta]|uniref:mpv17-like protein 2 n=1 Tax=Physella acuta TaxID=109671 RepID=UPI0027DB521B|nr:mpv17-like protein 2 [Physella acuta]